MLSITGDKAHKPHPADAAAAAAATPSKAQASRPASAVKSQSSLKSPVKAADIARQGSKVADISRQFSRAADLARQGSSGSDVLRQSSRAADISRQSSSSPQKASPARQSPTAGNAASAGIEEPAVSATSAGALGSATTAATESGTAEASKSVTAGISADSVPLEPAPTVAAPRVNEAGTLSRPVEEPSHLLTPAEDEAVDVQSDMTSQLALQQPKTVATATMPNQGQISAMSVGEPTNADHQTSANTASTVSNTPVDMQNTSAMSLPTFHTAGNNQMQTTLTAVQEDYIRMAGEQEEAAQAQAAADAMRSDADTQLYSTASNCSDSAVAGLFQPEYIPALPLNPRASTRRGNNALFQKLAAGQGSFRCHQGMVTTHMHTCMDSTWKAMLHPFAVTIVNCSQQCSP